MVHLNLKLSRIAFCLILACHLMALALLTVIALPLTLLLPMGMGITFSLYRHCREVQVSSPDRVNAISIGAQQCRLHCESEEIVASLPTIEYLSEFLIVLSFLLEPGVCQRRGRRMSVVLLPDSLPELENRRLRRYLRFDCPQ